MKKKMSAGEKREAQLRYHYRELKRAGKIPKGMSMKEFRVSDFNKSVDKKVKIKTKKGNIIERIVKKFISYSALLAEKSGPKPAKERKPKLTKEAKREEKRHLKHAILAAIQEAAAKRRQNKKDKREAKIAAEKERKLQLKQKKEKKDV